MNSFSIIRAIWFFLTLVFCSSLTGQYRGNNSQLTDAEKDRLEELVDELFEKKPDMAFNLSTSDLVPSFEYIPDPMSYEESYKDSLIQVLKNSESDIAALMRLANYYKGVNQVVLANSYYQKAFENLNEEFFEGDLAAYYSSRALLKGILGKPEPLEDLKESIRINPNDSLAVEIYPMILLGNGEVNKARKLFSDALEHGTGNKLMPYIKLISLEIMIAMDKISTKEKNGVDIKKKYSDKNFDELIDYNLIDKYAKMYENQLEMQWARRISDLAGLFTMTLYLDSVEGNKFSFTYTSFEQQKLDSLIHTLSEASGREAINEFSLNRFLGYCFFLNEEWDKSLLHFQRAIEVFPDEKRDSYFNTFDCHDMIMTLYIQGGDKSNYRKAILKKIDDEPDRSKSTDDWMLLAFDYYRAGMFEEANQICKEVMMIDANDFDAMRLKSQLNFLNGENQLSQFYLESASNYVSNQEDEYNLTLQYAIYLIYQGNAEMAKPIIKSLKESRGKIGCSLCDTLLKEL